MFAGLGFLLVGLLGVVVADIGITDKEEKPPFSDTSLFLETEVVNSRGLGLTIENGSTFLAYSPVSAPDFQVLGSEEIERKRQSIVSYQVKEGDSLESVARKFDISKDTIRWANSLDSDELSSGDELLILPTSGVLYYVRRGESLSEIANRHNAETEDIVAFNEDVTDKNNIKDGQQLIIPDGEKPDEPRRRQTPQDTHTGFAAVTYGTVTQGSHPGHANAVDIANACGTPVYATSSGTVVSVQYGSWPGGNVVRINHGNLEAIYAHMQDIYVEPGQTVGASQQIGTMGNTGYTRGSTGCHVHFETLNGSNPFRHLQRGQSM